MATNFFLVTSLKISTLLLAGTIVSPVLAQPIQVTVDVSGDYRVNGHDEIQSNIFGWTAYEGAPLVATPHGEELLRRARVPQLGFPGNIAWCAPESRPAGANGIQQWYQSDAARSLIKDRPLLGDRYPYGRILPAARRQGMDSMVYLLSGPAWAMGPENIPANDDEYAALCAGYAGLLREFDPKLRWFHLDNEPNARYFRANVGGKEYAQRFVKISRALKSKFPDAKIGGPVLLWPPSWPPKQAGLSNWYTWEQWTKPLLDSAGEALDFFDFHHYDLESREDRSEYRNIAREELALISNELHRRRGQRVPVILSEAGLALQETQWQNPAEHWNRRSLPWAEFLLDCLEQPDKLISVQAHDMVAKVAPEQSFQILTAEDAERQTPTYWLYWLLRHTRGRRLVASSASGEVRVFATRETPSSPEMEGKAAVVLLNSGSEKREVNLRFENQPEWLRTPRWERLSVEHELRRESGHGNLISLPPRSIAVAFVDVPPSVPQQRRAERIDIPAPDTLLEWTADKPEVTFNLTLPANVLAGAKSARLTLGLQGTTATDNINLRCGGQTYPVVTRCYFQEIPLRAIPSAGSLPVILRLEKRSGEHRMRASSLSLVLEK